MNNEAIGPAGDFITSPEVSQVFGEVLSKLQTQSTKDKLNYSIRFTIIKIVT